MGTVNLQPTALRGMGALIKITADDRVSRDADVNNIKFLVDTLKKNEINVCCSLVNTQDSAEIEKQFSTTYPLSAGL